MSAPTSAYSATPPTPRTAVVVGAGIVGLSCAWHLQEHGVDVTVVDREGVAAGASWGNAGYVSPSLVAPLPEPAVLRYGVRALLDRRSPVRIPVSSGLDTWRFLWHFARSATSRRWREGMSALLPLATQSQQAFDELVDHGVAGSLREAPILAVFERAGAAAGLLHEIAEVVACGQPFDIEPMSGPQARREEPLLNERIEFAVRIRGQRSLDPPSFVAALAAAVEARGGRIRSGTPITSVSRDPATGRVVVNAADGTLTADAVLLAAGAWLPVLARPHGVRMPMHAGRGYSFTVDSDPVPGGPLYFPGARSASTPTPTGLRITGLMDLDRPDDPLRRERVQVIQDAVARGLTGVDWGSRRDEWVGPRPLTADGLPLIGPTVTPGVFVAGGHGMWGLTLGPVTGRLLARQMVRGEGSDELRPFDPCR